MIKVKTLKVDIGKVKVNPDNPRTITKGDMEKLVKSLKEFPEMLEMREIVVDETMTVLGGNMRIMALRQAGAKKVTIKQVSGLSKRQKREFIIKDNAAFGEWDFDALANGWDDLPLGDWGIKDLARINKGIEAPPPGDNLEPEKITCPECGHQFIPI